MTTKEVAERYMELFRQDKTDEIRSELYSPDIICTEPEHAAAFGVPTITKGIEAVLAKSNARNEMISERHGRHHSEVVVGGNYFSVAMGRDLTFKNGKRVKTDEIAVFGVKDGKIVTETFFY